MVRNQKRVCPRTRRSCQNARAAGVIRDFPKKIWQIPKKPIPAGSSSTEREIVLIQGYPAQHRVNVETLSATKSVRWSGSV
jgi:alkylated DNA nucleotide flippase Atl1